MASSMQYWGKSTLLVLPCQKTRNISSEINLKLVYRQELVIDYASSFMLDKHCSGLLGPPQELRMSSYQGVHKYLLIGQRARAGAGGAGGGVPLTAGIKAMMATKTTLARVSSLSLQRFWIYWPPPPGLLFHSLGEFQNESSL